MHGNESHAFPGRWGELADLLRQTHATLEAAGHAGACPDRVAALSRAARHAVREAGGDVDRAVELVVRLAADAASLAPQGS